MSTVLINTDYSVSMLFTAQLVFCVVPFCCSPCIFHIFFVKPHIHYSGLLDFNHKWRYFEFIKSRATSSIASTISKNQWCGQNPAGLFFSESEMLSKTGSLPLARISWDLLFLWQAIKRQPNKGFFLVIIGWLYLKLCVSTL